MSQCLRTNPKYTYVGTLSLKDPQGKPQKNRLLALHHAYHGDTFATMAACDPVNGMHHLFNGVLPQHFFCDATYVK